MESFWLENPLDDPMFLDETKIVSAEKTDARIVDSAHRSIAALRTLLRFVVSPDEPPQSALGVSFDLEVLPSEDTESELAVLNLWTHVQHAASEEDDNEDEDDEAEEEMLQDGVWFAEVFLPLDADDPMFLEDGGLAIINIGIQLDGVNRNHEISIHGDTLACRTSGVSECAHCGSLHPVHAEDEHDETDPFDSITAELRDEGGADYRAFVSDIAAQRCVDFLAWLELALEMTRARWHTESD